jgi:hypothetical protein
VTKYILFLFIFFSKVSFAKNSSIKVSFPYFSKFFYKMIFKKDVKNKDSEIELTTYPNVDERVEKFFSNTNNSQFCEEKFANLALVNIVNFCKDSGYSEDFFTTNFNCNSLYLLRVDLLHQILTIKSLQDLIVLSDMLSGYYRISNEVFPNSKEKSYFTILTILFAQKEKTIFKGMLIYKFLKKNQDLDQHLSKEQIFNLGQLGKGCVYINNQLQLF